VAQLLGLVDAGTLSGKQAKEVYAKIAGTDRAPEDVVADLGLKQVSDAGTIEEVCQRVVLSHPRQAAELRAGKSSLMGFFVGQVMKAMGGSANPKVVNDVLRSLLGAGAGPGRNGS
jgi:aspartyl-tRNA(Asn)/glutamyl-tRNA(Gln) amidotransferase subunit B